MNGTAADMQILENLALAKRRGQHRGLKFGVTRKEKEEYIDCLLYTSIVLMSRKITQEIIVCISSPKNISLSLSLIHILLKAQTQQQQMEIDFLKNSTK